MLDHTPDNIAVIICVAGSSRRFGDRDKLAEDLRGRAVLQRSAELFAKHAAFTSILVAGPADPAEFDAFNDRFGDPLRLMGARLVPGGRTHRYETVQVALPEIDPSHGHVAIHDGARPITPSAVIDRVVDAAGRFDAVVPAVPVTDTLKRVAEETIAAEEDPLDAILGDAGKVNRGHQVVRDTVAREGLVAVQTPQLFSADLLRRGYGQADLVSTDDSQLVEKLGERVVLVEGDPRNIKITTPTDLHVARALLDERGEAAKRARQAFDSL